MSKKIVLAVVLVLLLSLAVAGIASAAVPRNIGYAGYIYSLDSSLGNNGGFTVKNGPNYTDYYNWHDTLYYYKPTCVVTQYSELMVGNHLGVWYIVNWLGNNQLRAVVVYPGPSCPQNP
jgi:hypothetical protein